MYRDDIRDEEEQSLRIKLLKLQIAAMEKDASGPAPNESVEWIISDILNRHFFNIYADNRNLTCDQVVTEIVAALSDAGAIR